MAAAEKHWIVKVPANNQEMETITGERVKEHGPFRALEATAAAPAMPPLQAGTVVKHYEFIRQIGAGGMGTVFLARDTRLGRLVAVKVLLKYTGRAAFRFLEEARTTAQCRHENIVVIYDVDEYDGYPYMVLEYIAGRTLRAAMTEHRTDAARFAVKTMLPVVRALVRAHEMGIVHRDLKPENILLAHDGSIKVLDFGIAKHISAPLPEPAEFDAFWSDENRLQQTKDGALVGTMAYMSPEQLLGQTVDERTDIWAVGVILYEIIAGRRPFNGMSHAQIIDIMQANENVPSIHERCPNLGSLADAVDRCFTNNKSERFSSAKELLEALEQVADEKNETTQLEDERPLAGLSARRRRRRFVAILVTAIAAVAVVVAVLALRAREQARRADNQTRRADERANEAEEGARRARNATRMAAARGLEQDPTTMLAVLREMETGPLLPGWDERVRWARNAGVAETVIHGEEKINDLAWSPDGHLGVVDSDMRARVWNPDFTNSPREFRGHDASIRGISWSADGRRIATASLDKTVRVQNADGTGEPTVLSFATPALDVAWSPNGKHLAIAPEDAPLQIWNSDGTGKPLVFRDNALVTEIKFNPAGASIVSIASDNVVRIWNTEGMTAPLVLDTHVNDVDISPDGRYIATASADNTVRVWNNHGTGEPRILQGHENAVTAVAFTADGQRIVSGSADRTIRIWNRNGTSRPTILRGHGDKIVTLRVGSDGHLVSYSYDMTLRRWQLDATDRPRFLYGHEGAIGWTSYSPDGRHILSASLDKTVRLWKADASGQPTVFQGHTDAVNSASYSADGQRFVTASNDKTVRIWNIDGHLDPIVLRGHTAAVNSAVFSPDGRRVVSASHDNTVRVWNADGSGEPIVLRGHEHFVYGAAFSPDGRQIVSTSQDKTVRIWNADGRGETIILRGHTGGVIGGAAYSPDGKHIVSGSRDKTLRIWNADGTGEPIVLRGHDALVLVHGDKPFSADGKRVVSSSDDGTVRIWNVDGTGDPIVLRLSDKPIDTASFSPDGQSIVAAGDDPTITVVSDLAPYLSAVDPRLWTVTSYCMPLEVRKTLLGFSDEQSRADLEHCRQNVKKSR